MYIANMQSALAINSDSNRLVCGRKFRFLGTNELARQMGLDPSTVCKVLRGQRPATANFMRRYRDATGKRNLPT